jgi:hypothetical protein
MTAQVIAFPIKPIDGARLAMVGSALRDAVPLASKDVELDLLVQIAEQLVGSIVDFDVDCFVVGLNQYDVRQA